MSELVWVVATSAAIFTITCANAAPSFDNSPMPSPDYCLGAEITNLMECLEFVTVRSSVTRPGDRCCDGVEKVVGLRSPRCLCSALKEALDMGVDVNITRAFELPRRCLISIYPNPQCNVARPPAPVPLKVAVSPSPFQMVLFLPPSPVPPPPPSSSPLSGIPAVFQPRAPLITWNAPALAPSRSSGLRSFHISLMVLLVNLIVAACSYN